MAKSRKEQWAEAFDKAKADMDAAVSACWREREQCLADRKFYSIAGEQWRDGFGEQFENRPRLEVNKIHLSVIRIINEYRNNRVTATFLPKENGQDEIADFCADLYRSDRAEGGEEALDNAFEEAVGGGFGAFRLMTEYEDEDDESDDLRIRFEPIYDADTSVFFDPGAKRQDKSDARFAFVLVGYTHDAFREEWGQEPVSFDDPISSGDDWSCDWMDADLVYVAEFYVKEETTKKLLTYRAIDGTTEEYAEGALSEDEERQMDEVGTVLIATKRVKRTKVRKYILSGNGVLEDCGLLAGSCIPIVPVYGKRWYVEGIERCMGHVRLAKDAQRLKNMQLSVLANISAMGGIDTPLVAPEQVQGFEYVWADMATQNPAYLPMNPIRNMDGTLAHAGPLGVRPAPSIPPAMAALLELSEQDIGDVLGNQDGGEQVQTQLSGRAVELIQSRLDEQSRIYITNFAKAEKRAAEIWLGMAQEAYSPHTHDKGRMMRVMDAQEQPGLIDLGETVIGDDGEPQYRHDITRAKMSVSIDIGPSSSSRRSATVRTITEMMPLVADPSDQKVLSAMALMNMEGEGLTEAREYYRRQLVQLGVYEPTDEDIERMQEEAQQQTQPSAQDQFLAAETQKSMAEAQRVAVDMARTEAQTAEIRAKTLKTLEDIDREAAETALEFAADMATAPPLSASRETGPRP